MEVSPLLVAAEAGYPLPEKAVSVWRGNARRGMAPRGDRLLERERL